MSEPDGDLLDDKLRYELRVGHDIAALRAMSPGVAIETSEGTYLIEGESVRGEPRYYWLERYTDGCGWRKVAGTPDSGRLDAVRRFAARHYRDLVERRRLHPPRSPLDGSVL